MSCWALAALRWRILLAPAPGLRIRHTFSYIAIGYLANTLLPMRLGELARATLIGRSKRLGVSRALGSIALERTMDLLGLIAVALMMTLVMELPAGVQTTIGTLAAVGVGGLFFLLFLSLHQQHLPRLTGLLAAIMPHRFADRIITLIRNFSYGAGVFRHPARVAAVLLLTLMQVTLAGVATLLWIRAFQLPVPWYGAYVVLVVVNLGSAIPSSPGYIGVYHYLAILALSLWVPDRSAALAYAIGTHALNMLANIGVGAFCLASEDLTLRHLTQEAAPVRDV